MSPPDSAEFAASLRAGAALRSYSRQQEQSIRKGNESRRQKRKEISERKEAEKAKLKEEIKRLKNLKKKEIEDKLRQIRAVAGDDTLKLGADELDEDFDEAKYDERMVRRRLPIAAARLSHPFPPSPREHTLARDALLGQRCSAPSTRARADPANVFRGCVDVFLQKQAFGEEYYEAEEEDEGAVKKPEFGDMEEELKELLRGATLAAPSCPLCSAPPLCAACDVGMCVGCGEVCVLSVPVCLPGPFPGEAKVPTKTGAGEEDDDDQDAAAGASGSDASDDGDDEEGGAADAGAAGGGEEENRFSKKAMKKWRRALQKKMDEYYRLDAEDFVAGLPCRFKYKPVKADLYGLKLEEVLLLEDKELNQVVSIKKMAPYRDDDDRPQYGGKRERALAALRRVYRERIGKAVRSRRTDPDYILFRWLRCRVSAVAQCREGSLEWMGRG